MKNIRPFLMFSGRAREALDFYKDVFDDFELIKLIEYGEMNKEHKNDIMMSSFKIKNQEILCNDSTRKHNFDFTPSFSLFITCDSRDELNILYEKLSKDGKILMPPNSYGFSNTFTWLNDKFGVSWQINFQ